MSVKVRSLKTKKLIAIFSVLTILTAGAGGFIIWQLTREDVGTDRGRASSETPCNDPNFPLARHVSYSCTDGTNAREVWWKCCSDEAGQNCDDGNWQSLGDCEAGYVCSDGTCVDSSTCVPNCIRWNDTVDSCGNPVERCPIECSGLSRTFYCVNFTCSDKGDVLAERCDDGAIAWENGGGASGSSGIEDGKIWYEGKLIPKYCFVSQTDYYESFNGETPNWTTYKGHTMGNRSVPLEECLIDDEEDFRCNSLEVNGQVSSGIGTVIRVEDYTDTLVFRLTGTDTPDGPSKNQICYSVYDPGNIDYTESTLEEGVHVFYCEDGILRERMSCTNGTCTGTSSKNFGSIRQNILGVNGIIQYGYTEEDINRLGILVVSNIYKANSNEFCSTNIGFNNGRGIMWPSRESCDGDNCLVRLELSGPSREEPVCTNISPKDVEIREATSITFTGTASSPGALEFRWGADVNCDGEISTSEWVTNSLTTRSLTNQQTFNFTPGSSEVCRVELQVNGEDSTRAVCTYDIPYRPPGDIIVDKTGPVCVERVAPNNVARFTVRVGVAVDSEQDTVVITRITDILPPGFRYIEGSVSFSIDGTGVEIGDPSTSLSGDVQTLIWSSAEGWEMNRGEEVVLIFEALATETARTGENINEVTVEIEDGDPDHDEHRFPVEQSCEPVPVTGVLDMMPYIVSFGLLLLGIYLYREDVVLMIPKVNVSMGLGDTSKLIVLKLTKPKEYYEEKTVKKLQRKSN